MRVNGSLSSIRRTSCGVPQGSILSPLLFSILFQNIPEVQNCEISMYADDISAHTISDTIEEATNNMQTAINTIHNWINGSGGKISEEKTKLMYFTNKRITNIPGITLNNTPLNFVTNYRFLGLILDGPHLTWREHVENLRINCQRKLDVMKSIVGKSWGTSTKHLKLFYTSYIKSRIDYGSVVYGSASTTTLNKLEIIQNTALRIIGGFRKTTNIVTLQVETNIPPITLTHQYQTMKKLATIKELPISHPTFQLISSEWNSINNINWTTFPHKAPFLIRAKNLSTALNIPYQNTFHRNEAVDPIPPWIDIKKIINTKFAEKVNKDLSSQETIIEHNYIIESKYQNHLQIYTDGSKAEDNSTGAAFHLSDIFDSSWKLEPFHSIVAAELFAILQALTFIYNNISPETGVVILSDSKTSLYIIQNPYKTYTSLAFDIRKLILNIISRGQNLALQWIPAHKGIAGNEKADKAANIARSNNIVTQLVPNKEELITYLKKQTHLNFKNYWNENKNLTSLHNIRDEIGNLPWLDTNIREETRILNRLRSGHAGLNNYLYKTNQTNSPNCLNCQVIEDREHYLLHYKRYTNQRNSLKVQLKILELKKIKKP